MSLANVTKLDNDGDGMNTKTDIFIESLMTHFNETQIIRSGDDYDLLAKDPVANARKPRAFIYPELPEQIQTLVRLAADCKARL